LGELLTGQKLESEILRQEADAKKAGYGSVAAAKVATIFAIAYPESVFRFSEAVKDASQRGVVFTASFSSYAVFKGYLEFSSKKTKLVILYNNLTQFQIAIDFKFPSHQIKHAKANAICSHILRRVYF